MSKLQSKLKKFDRSNYAFQRDTEFAQTQTSELTPRQLAALIRSQSIRATLRAEKQQQDLSPESKEFYGLI